jgi:DNA-binding transcriptional MerR regulator
MPQSTLADVARRAGARPRTIQHWVMAGVLQSRASAHPGTGVARVFDEDEIGLAALLVPLSRMNVPVGTLKRFADRLRAEIGSAHATPIPRGRFRTHDSISPTRARPAPATLPPPSVLRQRLYSAIAGEGQYKLFLTHSPDEIRIAIEPVDADGEVKDPNLASVSPPLDPHDAATIVIDLSYLSRLGL